MESIAYDVRGQGRGRGIDRRWWALVAGVVLAVALWGVAGRVQGAEQQAPTYQAAPAVAVKTAQAATGPIAASLSYTGDVRALSQVSVVAKATGRIEKLSVDMGTRVKKGDVLAELEAAALKAQVGQAKANLAAARAKLAGMEAGSREEQIAQAKANVEAARAKLAAMARGGREEQVAQAQAALDAAEARRSTVRKGATEADLQAAQGAVDSARANVQMAGARLEQAKQWPSQTEWGAALGAVDAARANLAGAEARLADLKAGPKQADLLAAQAGVEAARAALDAANDRRDYAADHNSIAQLGTMGVTSAGQAGNAANAAQIAYNAAIEKLNQLKSMPLPAEQQAAQSAVDGARANVMAAEFRVDQMKRGATKEDLQQAEGAVIGAEATLGSAESRLKQMKEGPTAEDLAQVDAAVAQAEQALALAEKPFRDEDLVQARAAVTVAEQQHQLALSPYTENDLAMARAAVDQARAAVEMAEIALSETVVVSPMDGVVAERLQSAGALVSPAAPIASLISQEVELVLGVEESQIGQVREGQRAEVAVAAYPGAVFPAKVAVIGPAADPRSRTFQVKVRPEGSEGKLRPGMFAQVKVTTEEKEQAVLAPKEAVVTRSGQTSVFVVNGEVVQLRPVKLGLSGSGVVEVLSGLSAGEELVVAGQNDLRDGDRVRRS